MSVLVIYSFMRTRSTMMELCTIYYSYSDGVWVVIVYIGVKY